jgi:hypothetical protein
MEAVRLIKVATREVTSSYDTTICDWFTLLAYLEKKHTCIWCEDGEL